MLTYFIQICRLIYKFANMLCNPIMIKKRWLTTKIEDALKTRRVTMLVGVRQCGKTTLACNIAQPDNCLLN